MAARNVPIDFPANISMIFTTVTLPVRAMCYTASYHNGRGGRTMTKDFLLRLTEERYGAGAFPVYGRLLEEQRLTRGGPLLPMWYCTAGTASQNSPGA